MRYRLYMMKDDMTVPEAATRLGVSRQRVLKLLRDGRIPEARKRGRDWLIPEGAKINPPPPRPRPSSIEIPPRVKGARKKARKAAKP